MIKKMIEKLWSRATEFGPEERREVEEILEELVATGKAEKRLGPNGKWQYRARTVPAISDRGTSHSTEEGQ